MKDIGSNALFPALAKAEAALLSAALREPHNFSQAAGLVTETAIKRAPEKTSVPMLEIIKQFRERGTYTVGTISAATNTSLAFEASMNEDIDLGFAVENWWACYEAYKTALAHEAAAVTGHSAEEMRLIFTGHCEESGIGQVVKTRFDPEEFAAMVCDRADGIDRTGKIKSGISAFCSIVREFKPGELWIIAGRPGMGKSQLLLNLAIDFKENGARGAVFSLEMSTRELLLRAMGVISGIDSRADWSTLDKSMVQKAGGEALALTEHVHFDDNSFFMHEIEAACTALKYQNRLDYVLVDFLQIVKTSGKAQNGHERLTSISRDFKLLAKRLNVPVIALSQLSRAVETRGGSKRPQLSDLRESGSLEENADGIVFLYRPDYYGITEDESGQILKGTAELIVAKHRNGPVDTAKVGYNYLHGFSDLFLEPFSPPSQSAQLVDYSAARRMNDEDIPF